MLEETFGKRAGAAELIMCWSCRGPVARVAPFCHTCGAVQPPGALDHFRRLGFEAGFDLDLETLERRYIAFQRHLHPDRFVAKSAKERALAQAQAVSLNEAYETLKDPLKRAQYLLRSLKDAKDKDTDATTTVEDKALLMDVLEQREALAAAPDAPTVERLAAAAGADAIKLVGAISTAFARADLGEAERLVTRLRYARKLLEETRARLLALEMV